MHAADTTAIDIEWQLLLERVSGVARAIDRLAGFCAITPAERAVLLRCAVVDTELVHTLIDCRVTGITGMWPDHTREAHRRLTRKATQCPT